jgi:catechol 2,3-dioxygenase-like lactoylglutathione lyase family enzyme
MVLGIGPLDVITIQVRDWAAAVSWYTDVLGLAIVAREDDHRFCMLRAGAVMRALASDHPEHAASLAENRMAPGFQVENLETTLAALADAGVRVDPELDGGDEGHRLARIWDPEGNRLHLYCYR